MKKLGAVCLALLLALSCCLTGCAEKSSAEASNIAGKTYTYEKDGFGSDFFISIQEDGIFTYSVGVLSSHFGSGSWTLEEDVVHLQEGNDSFYFQVDGSDLVFLSENSDNFFDVTVADGERFSS